MAIVVQVDQVLTVCPDILREDIERDLRLTGDTQETINRIFEGNFLVGVPSSLHSVITEEPTTYQQEPTSAKPGDKHIQPDQSTLLRDTDEDSDCNELPDIGFHWTIKQQGSISSPEKDFSSCSPTSRLHHTGKTISSATTGLHQSSPNEDILSGYCCEDTPIESIPRVNEGDDWQCVDLTLSPEKVKRDTVLSDSECFLSEEDTCTTSPISLSSNENENVNAETHRASQDQTNVTRSKSHALHEAHCWENSNTDHITDQAIICKSQQENNNPLLVGDNQIGLRDLSEEDTGLASRASDSLHPISSEDEATMDNDRCSPMSISSSSDDDEDEGIILSLLHRIRNKQTNGTSLGTNKPSNRFQDARSHDRNKCDRTSSRDFPASNRSNDAKKRKVDPAKNRKTYHDISDDDDNNSESVLLKTNSYPSSETNIQEAQYSSSRWETGTETLESCHSSSLGASSQGSSDNVQARKPRRTPVEIASAKQLAMERRAEKEQEKQAKMSQQMDKKQQKLKEAQAQKALRDAHKAEKPEECIKYVTVVIDPLLLVESGGAVLLTRLQDLNSKSSIESQPIPGSITWRRQVTEHNLGQDLQLKTLSQENEECEAVVQLSVASFVDMVHAFKQEQQGAFSTSQESLRAYASDVQHTLNGKAVTFIIQGMEKYFRLQKNSKQRNFRSAVLGNEPPVNTVKRRKKRPIEDITTVVTRVDIEEALVDLQLHVGCNVRFIETSEEVADIVAMFTKSVAETPFKRERDKATFSFHVDTEWAGGVKVGKDGKNLLRVWRQQLQQFRNVSPEIASSIIASYPSPKLLLQAYAECETPEKARKLLQDIVIRRGEGVLATTRRVGPELSKRVHTLMTSKQPELIL